MNNTQNKPFVVGDRVFNTANKKRKTIGIVTRVIDAEFCEVLWSDGEGYAYTGTIARDGSVNYRGVQGRENDRIVRVKLSVTIPQEV
jgi:hypothetical protein